MIHGGHLQADCQEPGSAPEPYARQSSMGYFYLFTYWNLLQNIMTITLFTQRTRLWIDAIWNLEEKKHNNGEPYN